MRAPRGGEVARGVVVEHLHVRHETGSREGSLDEIVAEQGVIRKSALGGSAKHVHVVDALAGERPLAEQVLIDVRHGRRVRVDARMPGVDGGEPRLARARQRHAHPRLQDAVAAHHASPFGVVLGAIERMGHGADECGRGAGRQDRVGIERHDIADAAQPREIAFGHGECGVAGAADVGVELDELAPLPLPPHPNAVGGVPSPGAVQEIEGRVAAAVVQRADAVERRADDRVVVLRGWRG